MSRSSYVAPDIVVGISGILHNMSVPPRTTVNYRTNPVYKATLVSFRHWLLFSGFSGFMVPGDQELNQLFSGCSPESIRSWLAGQGVSLKSADQAVAELGGVLIGKSGTFTNYRKQRSESKQHLSHLCDDLALTIGILSRAVGNLFLSSRPPDYTWDALLEVYFIFDDPRIPGQKAPKKITAAILPRLQKNSRKGRE
jgi:hypothetical protein